VPAKVVGQSPVSEPVILSNATSEPAAPMPKPAFTEPAEHLATTAVEPVAAPERIAVTPTAPPEPSPQPTVTPTPAPAESRGLLGLLVFTSVALGAIGLVVKVVRTKKAPVVSAAPRAARQAAAPPFTTADVPSPSGLETLRWDQFELLVGEIFRRQGYAVELSAALGADGGIDLMLRRDGESIPVQCKHWKTSKVAAREMREFYGAMADTASPRGIFVTTGSFTRDAREFATGKAIELIDGTALDRRIAAIRRPEENIFDVPSWIDDFTANARIFDPECPFCRGAMTVRHNRSTGAAFWGCTTYPRCAGKRDPRTDLLTASAV
jgi:restriction system protein